MGGDYSFKRREGTRRLIHIRLFKQLGKAGAAQAPNANTTRGFYPHSCDTPEMFPHAGKLRTFHQEGLGWQCMATALEKPFLQLQTPLCCVGIWFPCCWVQSCVLLQPGLGGGVPERGFRAGWSLKSQSILGVIWGHILLSPSQSLSLVHQIFGNLSVMGVGSDLWR